MKKTLLLQTALVAAAGILVADIANAQTKAQPLAISVGGYFAEVAKFQDRDGASGEVNTHSVGLAQDAEIYFNIRGVLDDGTVIGGRVELEAATDADQIDERYLFIERRDIGRAEVGSTDRASSKMVYGAPIAIPGYGTVDPTGSISVTNARAGARTGGNLTKFSNIDDREGINLYTSSDRYFGSKAGKGLQLGVSYTPDGCEDFVAASGNQPGCGAGFGSTTDAGQFSKVYTVAANYIESFGPVDVALFGAYERFSIEGNSAISPTNAANGVAQVFKQTGLDGWAVGTTLTYNIGDGSTVQLGGAYKNEETGSKNPATGAGGDERKFHAVGVRYLTNGTAPGSIGIGVDYAKTKADQGNVNGFAVSGEDEYTWYSLGVTYQIATGVLTFAGIGQYEYEDAIAAGTVVNGIVQADNDAKATFGVVGIRLDF